MIVYSVPPDPERGGEHEADIAWDAPRGSFIVHIRPTDLRLYENGDGEICDGSDGTVLGASASTPIVAVETVAEMLACMGITLPMDVAEALREEQAQTRSPTIVPEGTLEVIGAREPVYEPDAAIPIFICGVGDAYALPPRLLATTEALFARHAEWRAKELVWTPLPSWHTEIERARIVAAHPAAAGGVWAFVMVHGYDPRTILRIMALAAWGGQRAGQRLVQVRLGGHDAVRLDYWDDIGSSAFLADLGVTRGDTQ